MSPWYETNLTLFPKLKKRPALDERVTMRISPEFTQRLLQKRDEFQARLMKRSENDNREDRGETVSVLNPPKRYDYRLMKRSDKTGYEARLMKF